VGYLLNRYTSTGGFSTVMYTHAEVGYLLTSYTGTGGFSSY